MGTSSLVCDGITTALTITTPTQISLYANDEAGKKWAIQYEQLIVTPGFTLRWLLRQNDVLYTASEDGTLISLEGQAPTGALFRERGVETPSLTALATLATAELLCWTAVSYTHLDVYKRQYGGYVYFEAKNIQLAKHYSNAFGARLYGMPYQYSMALEEDAAQALLDIYTLEEGD